MSESRASRLGPTRAEVLHHLRTIGEPVPVSDVAVVIGLHQNTTRFHLDALTESGLVVREVEQRNQPGRPKVLYRAAQGHRANHYQELAGAMITHFAGVLADRSARAQSAGEAWGDELRTELLRTQGASEPLERLIGCMDELGYAPKLVAEPETVVELRPCPFLELADKDPDVVCQLHLGLVRGLLGPDQPWQVTDIEPWVTPTKCLLRLACEQAFGDRTSSDRTSSDRTSSDRTSSDRLVEPVETTAASGPSEGSLVGVAEPRRTRPADDWQEGSNRA